MANYAGFGMEVTVVSTSPKKEKEAREVLGADHFLISKDEAQMSVRTAPSRIVCLQRLDCRLSINTLIKGNAHYLLLDATSQFRTITFRQRQSTDR